MEPNPEKPGPRRWLLLLALGVLIYAGLIRLFGLDSNPPGFWQDEASTGLDAYLLWTTGRDRAGQFLPIIARSFGDYPLAGYRYLSAPIIGLFGPTPGHERLTAAIAGTLFVAFLGLAVRARVSDRAALGAMISGALCPTWIHFSRYGSEAILLPASLTAGWALFELGRRRSIYLWLSALALAFSAYTYHAVKLVLPLWLVAFVAFEWPELQSLWRSQRRTLLGAAGLFAILVLPSAYTALTEGGMARGRMVLAFYQVEPKDLPRTILINYFTYFDMAMLYVRGGPAVAQSMPGLGVWNLIDLPFMIAGVVAMAKDRERRRLHWFLLAWFLLGPLPGGLSYEGQNLGRAIAWLPAPQIISGLGMAALAAWVSEHLGDPRYAARVRAFALGALLAIGLLYTAWRVYIVTYKIYPQVAQRDFQFEIGDAMRCARQVRKSEKIIVSPSFHLSMFFAQFFFADLQGKDGQQAWELGDRLIINPGELYVFPASRPLPPGKALCTIVGRRNKDTVSYVYALEDPAGGQLPAASPGEKLDK